MKIYRNSIQASKEYTDAKNMALKQPINQLINSSSGLPHIYIHADNLNDFVDKTDIRLAQLTYRSADINFNTFIKIKPQGSSSLIYDKKTFQLRHIPMKNTTQNNPLS